MLIWATSPGQLRFGQLRNLYPDEQDQSYLLDTFFRIPGAVLALWEQEGAYVSGLRLEPYRDGILIAGLVTAPELRRKGYARALLQAVQSRMNGKLYSHVDKKNTASLAVHEQCGFRQIKDCAAYLDGSVDFRCCTLLYEK